ncbi:MAG TPA: S-methyl-5-thioribose-1-phosphate isomerase [Myxococcales bacterium]
MSFRTLWFEDGALHLLDQRRLPARAEIVTVRSARATADAIREMVVRGAPAIGCAAAYGMALAARAGEDFETARQALLESRPTAVNLRWAVERLWLVQPRTFEALKAEADRVLAEDLAACRAIGRNGAALVPDGKGILTHCNAGGLATAGYGTALGVVRAALEAGKKCGVFADETRPWLQGARLTAWELLQDGIPVTLLPDVAAASLLGSGRIGCVVVGADRIARNGDTANKVGTYPLALAAQAAEVPFFVAAPTSTVDLRARSGREIPIEQRSPAEVTHLAGARVAAEGVDVFNPAFDVTPARYISAIVTERGVARAPFDQSLPALLET